MQTVLHPSGCGAVFSFYIKNMQYNTEANSQDLISDMTFWTGVGLTDFSLNTRTRSANEWLNTVWTWIFESYGGWLFMDDNVSDSSSGIPSADGNITSGIDKVGLPSAALTVIGVQLKTTSGGTFRTLTPMTYEEFLDRGGDGSWPSTGIPEFYIMQGDICRLLPSPNFTLASAIRFLFDQGMSLFVPSDTIKTPGFASVFHRILSIGPSMDYVAAHSELKDKLPQLVALRNDYERRIRAFYSKRYKARFPANISTGEDLVDEFS